MRGRGRNSTSLTGPHLLDSILCYCLFAANTQTYLLYLDSYNTLFELMVVNNWQLIMDGHVATTSKAARTYFFVYFLFVVLVVNNVIVAFLLDAFIKIHPLMRSRAEVSDLLLQRGDVNQAIETGDSEQKCVPLLWDRNQISHLSLSTYVSVHICLSPHLLGLFLDNPYKHTSVGGRRGCKILPVDWRHAFISPLAAKIWIRLRKNQKRTFLTHCLLAQRLTLSCWVQALPLVTRQ